MTEPIEARFGTLNASTVSVETRPGWKTTEFAITVITIVAGAIQQALDLVAIPDRYVGLAQMVVAGLYVVSRGLAKQGVSNVAPLPALTQNITTTSSTPSSEEIGGER